MEQVKESNYGNNGLIILETERITTVVLFTT